MRSRAFAAVAALSLFSCSPGSDDAAPPAQAQDASAWSPIALPEPEPLPSSASGDASPDVVDAAEASAGTMLPDFHVPGTQIGDVPQDAIYAPLICAECHGMATPHGPTATWSGSLMANAGRDPLFFAQLTNANQDVPAVGQYCVRCHAPLAVITGTVVAGTEQALGAYERQGVTCHFCHSMVDPIARPEAPAGDDAILHALADVPTHYGNAAFVIDPAGLRRGPFKDATPPHPFTYSPFQTSGDLCGTCHDVGNVRITKRPDGTFGYVQPGMPAPDPDPHGQFPLERTYTEWKLSAFANGGVDMQGRFGGDGGGVVSTCQDCHMPKTTDMACRFGPTRQGLPGHDFAGASSWVLDMIATYYAGQVDAPSLAKGRDNAIAMVGRAASLVLEAVGHELHVRVVNESGHKLPTGHIEGRRVWANVQALDAGGAIVQEFGAYDDANAEVDESSTTIFEMGVGLSDAAAKQTGLPPGRTTHMSLADTIVKDTRIPPRGFANAPYEDAGAPAVGAVYADGQYWADQTFVLPASAVTAKVTVYYQTATRHYVEALRDGNHTDTWGTTLYDLWTSTGKSAPVAITSQTIAVGP